MHPSTASPLRRTQRTAFARRPTSWSTRSRPCDARGLARRSEFLGARTSSRSTACWRSQSGSPTGPGRNERDPAVKGPCKAGASAAVPVGGLDHASEPDALAGVVPFDARERLSPLLADDDVATLKHLVREGMEASTLRALASTSDTAKPGAGRRPALPSPGLPPRTAR